MTSNMVLVSEDAVYHLTARQLDPASFYDYMTRGIDYKHAFCHHGDHGRFARVTTCHSCTEAETRMLGVVGVLTTPLTFTTPAINFTTPAPNSATTEDNMYTHPVFGVREGLGIPSKWSWDPAVAFPGASQLRLVFGVCGGASVLWLTAPKCPVYRLPMSNTFDDGRLCMNLPHYHENASPFVVLEDTLAALQGSPFSQDLRPDRTLAEKVFRYRLDEQGNPVQCEGEEGLESLLVRVSPSGTGEQVLEELLRRWGCVTEDAVEMSDVVSDVRPELAVSDVTA